MPCYSDEYIVHKLAQGVLSLKKSSGDVRDVKIFVWERMEPKGMGAKISESYCNNP